MKIIATKIRPGGNAAPAFLPLLIPVLVCAYFFIARRIADPDDGVAARNAAHALVGAEMHRIRAKWDREAAVVASAQSRGFVRRSLLPTEAADEKVGDLAVMPLKRGRYRVRGTVAWRGERGTSVTRRFETDLLHGPTDDNWRLVDTEFLP